MLHLRHVPHPVPPGPTPAARTVSQGPIGAVVLFSAFFFCLSGVQNPPYGNRDQRFICVLVTFVTLLRCYFVTLLDTSPLKVLQLPISLWSLLNYNYRVPGTS